MTRLGRLLGDLVRQRGGVLTDELARVRPGFGLGQVPARLAPDRTVSTVCGFCSTGCSLDVHVRDGRPVNITPTASYPVNLGMACPKGWEALTPLRADDRATRPLLRDQRGRLQPVSWEQAGAAFASRFKDVQRRHGPDSVAFLSTGQIPTEEMALLGTVAKFGMGMVHGDGNTRQCMATSVVAHKETFGFDAPPYTYADLEESDVIVLLGSNLCVAHPILWERVCRNPHRPEIIVVDPRKTETAMAATQHYALRPKSDLVLLYGLANLLITRGWIDEGFIAASTDGFEEFAAHVARYPLDDVAARTGLSVAELDRFATAVHEGRRVSFWWTMGVNQSHEGVRSAEAIIALALLTGNIGRPGTGANSITGQCNAMGSRLFSNTTNLLGGRDFADAADRALVAGVLGIEPGRIPDRPSLAYDQILEGVVSGRIRGLWIVATNTAHSWINQTHGHDVLDRLDFLVVQDMYQSTETAQRADLILPAAGWGEKTGTFINSERRIGVVRRVADPPGEAMADFDVFRLLADAWGCGELVERWTDPEAAFGILRLLSAGRPFDFSGVSGYEMVERHGGVQWPCPTPPDAEGTERRLFADGRFFTPTHRARFVFGDDRKPDEPLTSRHPLILMTGRGSSAQWHTGTRTSKSPILRSLSPEQLYVDISPGDAEARGILADDEVIVSTARDHVRARAAVTPNVGAGQIFLPMHHADTNRLTAASFDPQSRQPSYKWSAAEVRRAAPEDVASRAPNR
ncbi:MAG TPA: nitrate reductase [Acidimicrobiales bacterium]|nr:nitrate reductase [Acidimicrobiales bacterium]